MSNAQPAPASPAPALPLFYKNVRPLDRQKDGALKLKAVRNYQFAKHTNAIPLVIDDVGIASVHYPIVFAGAPIPVPVAVMGVSNGQNIFIDAKHQWRKGSYIPSYVRRFPFILMENATPSDQMLLCIDEASNLFGADGEFSLFENGEPSKALKDAMDFCTNMRRQAIETTEFAKALMDQQLLIGQEAKFTLANGTEASLTGFQMIDATRLQNLPDAVIGDWHRRGWLALVYAHLLSSQNWQKLLAILNDNL